MWQGWGPAQRKRKGWFQTDFKAKADTLQARADAYFQDEENRPYSIQEAAVHMQVDCDALCRWETGEDESLAALSKYVKARVASGWEKGSLPAALTTYLYQRYFDGPRKEQQANEALTIEVRVLDDP